MAVSCAVFVVPSVVLLLWSAVRRGGFPAFRFWSSRVRCAYVRVYCLLWPSVAPVDTEYSQCLKTPYRAKYGLLRVYCTTSLCNVSSCGVVALVFRSSVVTLPVVAVRSVALLRSSVPCGDPWPALLCDLRRHEKRTVSGPVRHEKDRKQSGPGLLFLFCFLWPCGHVHGLLWPSQCIAQTVSLYAILGGILCLLSAV